MSFPDAGSIANSKSSGISINEPNYKYFDLSGGGSIIIMSDDVNTVSEVCALTDD